MLLLVALALAVSLTHAQPEADPCCLTPQYEGFMTEHGLEGNINGPDPLQYMTLYEFHYDNSLSQITINYTLDGNPDGKSMGYFDYGTETVYFLYLNGSCVSQPTIRQMRRPCEAPDSQRVAFFLMGLDTRDMRWAFSSLEQESNGQMRMQQYDVWDYSCGLLYSSTFVQRQATGDFASYAQSYANMKSGITDPTVFDIPPVCLASK